MPLVLEEEMEDQEEMESKELTSSPTHHPISSTYSLSSGAASHTSRSPSYSIRGSSKHKASASSSSSTTTSELCMHRSPWQEEVGVDLPSINPSDLIQTLLSQLASSISAMKGAFAHLQATLRADSGAKAGASAAVTTPTAIMAENVMVEELQRLSDLHMRLLYSVLQEQYGGMQQGMKGSPESTSMQESVCRNAEKPQDGMLKSYEGIISRFYDEIKKKDAVAEALKDTLAKSMLKGEKLERRVKFLEAKLSLK